MTKEIPKEILSHLSIYKPQIYDGTSGEPIGWGYEIINRLGDEQFNGLRQYGSPECVYPSWFLITKHLTREEAIKQYGPITDEEFGPRGGWKSVTFGETKFSSRQMME